MPAPATADTPLVLLCGDDDFALQQAARALYDQWRQELGGDDHETIDASAGNTDEALRAIGRLREALLTLPFFGTGKAVWFKHCSFLGDDRVALSEAVGKALGDLAQLLKTFSWQSVRLLITAPKVDKRKTFYKTLEKAGRVQTFEALSLESKNWAERAEEFARHEIKTRGKSIAGEALAELVQAVGPNLQQLATEVEKLALFIGARAQIESGDIQTVVSRQKQARAFALGDALGERNLAALLRHLDEEMWAMQFDKKRSEVGLLYSLISKVRAMLFAKELAREGLLRSGSDYYAVKAQMEKWPANRFGADKKLSPAGVNPFVMYRALQHSDNYTRDELVEAMDILLDANLKLVSSGLDEVMVLQQSLVRLTGTKPPRPAKTAPKSFHHASR